MFYGKHQSVSHGECNRRMNDEAAIRRSNLQRLCKARQWGPTELHQHAGRSYSFWPSLLKGPKSFGEKLARSIEDQLDLPRGWLDREDAVPLPIARESGGGLIVTRWLFSLDLYKACDELEADERGHLENVMRAFLHMPPLPHPEEQKAAA